MKLEDLYLCRGSAFFSAYHSRSQVVQIQQGTRDDQQLITHLKEEASEDAEHKVLV